MFGSSTEIGDRKVMMQLLIFRSEEEEVRNQKSEIRINCKHGIMDSKSKSFQDLIVWQKAHQFVLSIYKITKLFPKEELYGLTNQFRRAAVSIAANIAEGFRKNGKLDKLRFYNIAQGSLEECRYYLVLTQDLEYANTSPLLLSIEEVSKILNSYMEKIRNSN
jgi:four helix bundle protein